MLMFGAASKVVRQRLVHLSEIGAQICIYKRLVAKAER